MNYKERGYQTFGVSEEGEEKLLANFTARIVKEVRYVDGMTSTTELTVNGLAPNREQGKEDEPIKLPDVTVNANDFDSLNWVLPNWGVQCVMRPGAGVRADLRTAILLNSEPVVLTVYKHTGWTTINGKKAYLHAGGAITGKGNDPSVNVRLPMELSKYSLEHKCENPKEAIAATLELIGLTRPEITWPLLAATICPMYGQVDFGLHMTGRTGTFKSEVMSLFQSHYGSGMDARHLPGSWASTPNALEALAYHAANAAFVIDDFVPTGSAWQQRAYQTNADKIIRAQGNQSGRSRMTDSASLRGSMYPRGIVLSTGEDTPEGHSVRARMLILELSPGEIDTGTLTKCQRNRTLYPATMACLAQELAEYPVDITTRAEEIRNKNLGIGHSRTPAMLGKLCAVIEHFLAWCGRMGALSDKQVANYTKQATNCILTAGEDQTRHLEGADPVQMWMQAIRQVLATGGGHLRTLSGGIPLKANAVGWTEERASGEMATYKARGPTIGWIDWNKDEIFLDVTAGFPIVRKAAGSEFSLTKQTLFKRLKEAGKLTRVDESRTRNTVRVTADNIPRQVLAMSASEVLEMAEKPTEEENDEYDDE